MTKIIYDNNNKNNIINNLNSCINDLNIVNGIIYNMDVPYNFKYRNYVNDIRVNLERTKESISKYKNDINRYMEELNKNELEVLSLINKIEDNVVNKF